MANADDTSDKSYEPTQKKLDDARKKGDIPRSTDLQATAAYFGLLLGFLALGSGVGLQALSGLQSMLESASEHADLIFGGHEQPFFMSIFTNLSASSLRMFGLPSLCVILLLIATKTLIFTPSKLKPKGNRLSIVQNAKNKFGKSGLFDFSKSFLKLILFSLFLSIFFYGQLDTILPLVKSTPGVISLTLWKFILQFMGIIILISLAIGMIDFIFQASDHKKKLMMSRKEVMDEAKESEGDPYLKNERRKRGQDFATKQSVQDAANADVIITNPTHFAVALSWSRKPREAPVCVAKGQDEIAAQIRKVALENKVPMHQDPPTARAIFATTEIGAEITPDLYQAVAVAIRFAEAIRAKKSNSVLS